MKSLKQFLLMSVDEISSMQSVVKLERDQTSSKKLAGSVSELFNCEFEDCCQNTSLEKISSDSTRNTKAIWEEILTHWTPTERTMFNCHYGSFKNYCIVASLLMGGKTCRDVMRYHELSSLMCNDRTLGASERGLAQIQSPYCTPTRMTRSRSKSLSLSPSTPSSANSSWNSANDEEIVSRELNTFVPCSHENGICDTSCRCVAGKRVCETTCGCFKSCKNRFKGCTCFQGCDTKRCPCYMAGRECDPDLCKNCGSHEVDIEKVSCKNICIQRKLGKQLIIKKSTITGWGTFASNAIKKGEMIGEYTGEMISTNETEKRGLVYDEKNHTFLFELTKDITLDAARMGSNIRFMNSSERPNCEAIPIIVRGEQRLAIRALKYINKDEELFINYHSVLVQDSLKDDRSKLKFFRQATN